METLLGFTSERRVVRYVHTILTSFFPYLPQQSDYHKRQRALIAGTQHILAFLANSTGLLGDGV